MPVCNRLRYLETLDFCQLWNLSGKYRGAYGVAKGTERGLLDTIKIVK